MAKLNAPLFSFGASGAIAKALVYFGWKGLDVVRSYIVPTNPKSKPQRDHRAHLTDAVTTIHEAQANPVYPLLPEDQTALALLGSTRPTPRTWFNEAVKNWVDRRVKGKHAAIFRFGHTEALAADKVHLVIYYSTKPLDLNLGTANFYYGTSKTALINISDDVVAIGNNHYNLPDEPVTPSTKYFWQLRVKDGQAGEGNRSGIYKFTTPAE